MAHINFEFKAKTNNLIDAEIKLKQLQPEYKGEDHQTDTYFNVPNGRLKLREGNIENSLIYYERENKSGAKQSNVLLYRHQTNAGLKEILTKVHDIKIVVKKKRKIYFVENVKIHFDEVEDLGHFIEVEAIDKDGSLGIELLKEQCAKFAKLFDITDDDYIAQSYSDLLITSTPIHN
ncbi:MAG: class IV adenylate cyclase [Niabella sp.]